MIRLLLSRGADPNRGENDSSPLKTSKLIAHYPKDIIDLLEQHTASETPGGAMRSTRSLE